MGKKSSHQEEAQYHLGLSDHLPTMVSLSREGVGWLLGLQDLSRSCQRGSSSSSAFQSPSSKGQNPSRSPFITDRTKGWFGVVDEEELEFVDIERCFYPDRIAQGTDGCLNGSVFDKMLRR